MLDYYGSFIKSKDEIYLEMISLYPTYNKEYITSKLDHLYKINYINKEVSVSGWMVFVKQSVKENIDILIQEDVEKAKLNLLTCTLLNNKINHDIIYKICFN